MEAVTLRTDSVALHARDSMSESVEVSVRPLSVPRSEVSLTIAADSLLQLPPGASYSGRSGQASVRVGRIPATATAPERIRVEASCDSLMLQCERYERTIRRLRQEQILQKSEQSLSAYGQEEVEKKPPNTLAICLPVLFYGMGLVAVIALVINILKNKRS